MKCFSFVCDSHTYINTFPREGLVVYSSDSFVEYLASKPCDSGSQSSCKTVVSWAGGFFQSNCTMGARSKVTDTIRK